MRPSALALAGLLAAVPAAALIGDVTAPVGLDGSLRTLAAGLVHYDAPLLFGDARADVLSQSVLRLALAGRPRPALSYELHAIESIDYASGGTPLGTTAFGVVPGAARYRALDLGWRQREQPDVDAFADVDRASATLHLARADVTVGRQAITFGKTYFWNPLDVFLAFAPQQFDREYKPGVDALRIDVPLGAFAGLNLVGAAGRTIGALPADRPRADASWFGSAIVARAFGTLAGFDLSLQGGKVFGGWQVGAGAVGELGPLETRLEATGLVASGSPPLLPGLLPPRERLVEDAAAVVVGTGHRFENTLTLEAEYFYHGAGDPAHRTAAFARLLSGATLGVSTHLAGLLASYEILPILTGQIGGIVSFDDPSVQVLPQLTWSAADEIEILAGAIISRGARPGLQPTGAFAPGSEFGTYSDVVYLEVKAYF